MRLYYDLHIHSVLSPCGSEDMTPNNIVNMAVLIGLDVIAVTDHNSCKNIPAVMAAAGDRIKVIPGMEITTSEEVHVLCYFPDVESAEDMGRLIGQSMCGIKNRPQIFGRQLVLDENDNVICEEEELLISAVNLDIYRVANEVHSRGGIFVPAHIDKDSYSVSANLGFMPPDLEIDGVEITEKSRHRLLEKYKDSMVLTSSDAHYLENIAEKKHFLDTGDKITENILKSLCII